MDCFLVYISISCILAIATGEVTLKFEMRSNITLKGASLEISCSVSKSDNPIIIWKENTEITNCGEQCAFHRAGFSVTSNTSGIFGCIRNVSTEDQGIWKCSYVLTKGGYIYSNNWNLSVYTIPSGLSITQKPDQNVDLSVNSVVMQCKTIGCTYPVPTVQWIFKDQATPFENINAEISQTGTQENCTGLEMIYTSTLQLPQYTTFNDNSDKTGTFSCRIEYPDTSWNIISNASHSVIFAVHVRNITLEPSGDIITSLDGTNASLKCTAGPSRPQPVITWWLDMKNVTNLSSTTITGTGSFFSASSELIFPIEKAQQNKTVYCDARVNGQVNPIESVKTTINVWYQPSVPFVETVQGTNFPWLENQTGTLHCVMADPGNPKATVKWTSSRGGTNRDRNLVLRNLSATDHGQPVYCQVQNNFTDIKGLTVVSPTIFLNVEYRPSVSLNPSVQPLRIKEGCNLTVTCLASGNPNPMVQWKNRNPPNNTLHIPKILRNNTGSYTCEANSTSTNYNRVVLQREESTTVIVEYTPDVRVNITGSTLVGSTSVLMCTAQGEPPQYTFHPWIHRVGQTEIRILNGEKTDSISSLTLTNISIQDMGSYICTVNNSITGLDGQLYQTGDTSVYVQGPPVFGETENTFIREIGKASSIEIPFYSSSTKTTAMFQKGSELSEMSNTSDVYFYMSPSNITLTFHTVKAMVPACVAVLSYTNLTDRDFDNYTLQLFNEKGNVAMKFALVASGPPSAPKKFFFKLQTEDKFLVFGLEKGFNGGHEQTFVIEHKPFGNCEANWSTLQRIKERDLGNLSTNGAYDVTTPKLQDGQYIFKVYAENEKGKSSAIEDVYVEVKTEHPGSLPVPAITGAIIGAAVLVIIIVIIVLFVKRRSQLPANRELNINPIYDSSNPDPLVPVYAAVTKPKKPIGQNEDSNVYAQVDKSKGNKSKANKSKRLLKTDPSTSECTYENSGLLTEDPSTSECVYENPGNPNSSSSKSHLVDKNGFLYADLELDPPTTKNGKPVIHGLENRTEYAEIAYGKRGEPLPDRDEEN